MEAEVRGSEEGDILLPNKSVVWGDRLNFAI